MPGAWSSQVLVASQVVIQGTPDSLLMYNGAPALGNLIASIAPAGSVDPYGNQYLAGITTYDRVANLYVSSSGGATTWGPIVGGVPQTTLAGGVAAAAAALNLFSAVAASGSTDEARLSLLAGAPSQPTGSATAPHVAIADQATNSAVDLWLSGSIIKTDNGGGSQVWQTPTPATNFLLGDLSGTTQPLQYRLDSLNNTFAEGAVYMTLAAGLAAGAYAITTAIPAAYRPLINQVMVAAHCSSTSTPKAVCLFQLLTTGVFRVVTPTAIAQNDIFYLGSFHVLGAIP